MSDLEKKDQWKIMKFIQFDTDPQQTILGNLQTGLQIVATINMENLLDTMMLDGKEKTSTMLGAELIDLLSPNGRLTDSIDPTEYIKNITALVAGSITEATGEKHE